MQFEASSLLKYLTDKWQLGPLGRRVASAQSIANALNQSKPRDDTIPFIRVPYTNLMPKDPELERLNVSRNHEAIHAFAAFLAQEQGVATGALVEDLARGAGVWMRAKAQLGRLFTWIAQRLNSASEKQSSARVNATTEVARRATEGARQVLPRQ